MYGEGREARLLLSYWVTVLIRHTAQLPYHPNIMKRIEKNLVPGMTTSAVLRMWSREVLPIMVTAESGS